MVANSIFKQPVKESPAPLALTAKQAAAVLGVSVRTIHNLVARDVLPSFKIGTRRLFSARLLKQWVENQGEEI